MDAGFLYSASAVSLRVITVIRKKPDDYYIPNFNLFIGLLFDIYIINIQY